VNGVEVRMRGFDGGSGRGGKGSWVGGVEVERSWEVESWLMGMELRDVMQGGRDGGGGRGGVGGVNEGGWEGGRSEGCCWREKMMKLIHRRRQV